MAYTFDANPSPIIKPYVVITTNLAEAVPAKSAVDTKAEVEALGAGGTFSTWQTAGAIEEGVTVTGDKDITIKTSTGRTLVLSEKLDFSANDLNFAGYSGLRSALNNVPCQILLIDPLVVAADGKTPHAENVILSVLPDIGEQVKSKVTGEGSSADLDDLFTLVTLT